MGQVISTTVGIGATVLSGGALAPALISSVGLSLYEYSRLKKKLLKNKNIQLNEIENFINSKRQEALIGLDKVFKLNKEEALINKADILKSYTEDRMKIESYSSEIEILKKAIQACINNDNLNYIEDINSFNHVELKELFLSFNPVGVAAIFDSGKVLDLLVKKYACVIDLDKPFEWCLYTARECLDLIYDKELRQKINYYQRIFDSNRDFVKNMGYEKTRISEHPLIASNIELSYLLKDNKNSIKQWFESSENFRINRRDFIINNLNPDIFLGKRISEQDLCTLVKYKFKDLIVRFLEQGFFYESALNLAIQLNYKEEIEWLSLAKYVQNFNFDSIFFTFALEPNGNNLITHAISNKDYKSIELFLKLGANINQPNKFGDCAFHIAAQPEIYSEELIRFLIKNGARVDIVNHNGELPIDLNTDIKNFYEDYIGNQPEHDIKIINARLRPVIKYFKKLALQDDLKAWQENKISELDDYNKEFISHRKQKLLKDIQIKLNNDLNDLEAWVLHVDEQFKHGILEISKIYQHELELCKLDIEQAYSKSKHDIRKDLILGFVATAVSSVAAPSIANKILEISKEYKYTINRAILQSSIKSLIHSTITSGLSDGLRDAVENVFVGSIIDLTVSKNAYLAKINTGSSKLIFDNHLKQLASTVAGKAIFKPKQIRSTIIESMILSKMSEFLGEQIILDNGSKLFGQTNLPGILSSFTQELYLNKGDILLSTATVLRNNIWGNYWDNVGENLLELTNKFEQPIFIPKLVKVVKSKKTENSKEQSEFVEISEAESPKVVIYDVNQSLDYDIKDSEQVYIVDYKDDSDTNKELRFIPYLNAVNYPDRCQKPLITMVEPQNLLLFSDLPKRTNRNIYYSNNQESFSSKLPLLPSYVVDVAAGYGDGVCLGVTSWVRKKLGINYVVDEYSKVYNISFLVGEATATYIYAKGGELNIGNDLRIAPLGNRTKKWYGELPHYHRRGPIQSDGRPPPGQGISRHRPWESKNNDTSFWDRF